MGPTIVITFLLVSVSVPDKFGESYLRHGSYPTQGACQKEADRLTKEAAGRMAFRCLDYLRVVPARPLKKPA